MGFGSNFLESIKASHEARRKGLEEGMGKRDGVSEVVEIKPDMQSDAQANNNVSAVDRLSYHKSDTEKELLGIDSPATFPQGDGVESRELFNRSKVENALDVQQQEQGPAGSTVKEVDANNGVRASFEQTTTPTPQETSGEEQEPIGHQQVENTKEPQEMKEQEPVRSVRARSLKIILGDEDYTKRIDEYKKQNKDFFVNNDLFTIDDNAKVVVDARGNIELIEDNLLGEIQTLVRELSSDDAEAWLAISDEVPIRAAKNEIQIYKKRGSEWDPNQEGVLVQIQRIINRVHEYYPNIDRSDLRPQPKEPIKAWVARVMFSMRQANTN